MPIFQNPRREYQGPLEDYPLENYPDYEPGMPPRTERLAGIHFLDEVERIWGSRWGGDQGIGRLREVGLIRPNPQEASPLWQKEPRFFLLRQATFDLERLERGLTEYASLLESEGVRVRWMEVQDTWGGYGPMRKMFMGGAMCVLKGGVVLPRYGQNSYVRGRNPNFQRFFASINCPILHMIHGEGICEPGVFVPIAENALLAGLGSTCNEDGLEQFRQVAVRNGVTDLPVAHYTTIHETFEAGGEFHVDMYFAVVDVGVALIYPAALDYQAYRWLAERGFRFIEVPPEEHRLYCPANLMILEPGKVIMPAQAKETIRRVRAAGVKVLELDTSGIMAGTNGIRCVTMRLVRDEGPSLSDIPRAWRR
jgi:N-dimethylarginine dimethylaminohydrolase